MNQHASALLFSDRTIEGLRSIGDYQGAGCIGKLSNSLIKALDVSGVSADMRIKYLVAIKHFVEEKNKLLDRIKRADSANITNELYQIMS